jgi:ATP-dependent protease ClpP protease subunit
MCKLLLGFFVFISIFQNIFAETEFNSNSQLIQLNRQNLITLRGEINDELTSELVRKLNKFTNNQLYLYITSPGGSVISGMQIIDQLKSLRERNIKLVCIGDFAASMAFAIFQSCPVRYITSSSILMQHQMSLQLNGNLQNVNNYLDFIRQIDDDLEEFQAAKLQMDKNEFTHKVMNDWWLSGNNIVKNKAADSIILVSCDPELVGQNDEVKKVSPFVDINIIFSKCPLSREPLDVKIKTKLDSDDNKEVIKELLSENIPSQFISKLIKKRQEPK